MSKSETVATKRISENPNLMVPFYIMASYAYYVEDSPIFSDGFYDKLAKKILKNWDTIEHYHKHFLDKDALDAGSYLGDYPLIIQGAVSSWRKLTH